MSAETRLILASNRLPFCVEHDSSDVTLQAASGGLAAALSSVHGRGDHVWVGWPGDCSGLDDEQRDQLSTQLDRRRVVPVHLTAGERSDYYDGVCNSVLWPVFHSLIDRLPVTLPDFRTYRDINERFADAVTAAYRDGDIVWIHDYHLLLAPAMVRAHRPDARIGFFFHTPFPAADVFRVLPWRRELVDGVLGSTLVGFQTPRDAANFAGVVLMLTEYRTYKDTIVADRRTIRFGAYPIGIDPGRLERAHRLTLGERPGVLDRVGGDARLLLGVDRLDYTKGIPRRLAAFERLLADDPGLRGRIELLQIAVPSRGQVSAYAEYGQEVAERVERINAQFATAGWTPVHYVTESLSPADLAGVYRAADVMLVTSLRDGMNLVAKEFVSARTDEDGVLILSEMTGAADELHEAILVNPYAIDQLADAIRTSLGLDRNERRRRMRALRTRVAARPIDLWVDRFVADLTMAGAAAPAPGHGVVELLQSPMPPDAGSVGPFRTGLADAPPLTFALVYEGTLVEHGGAAEHASPDPELLALLGTLAIRTKVDIHILSSLDHAMLGRCFDNVPVTVCAEDGLWIRDRDERRWRRAPGVNVEWMADVREFLDHFTTRTPGAFVEERASGLSWHFGRSDRVTGRARAQELYALLCDAAETMGFAVALGDASIVLRHEALSRAHTIRRLLKIVAARRLVVFEPCGSPSRTGAETRDVLRPSDVLVTVGGDAAGDGALPDFRAVRDVLQTIAGSQPPVRVISPFITSEPRPHVTGTGSGVVRVALETRS